MESGSQPPHVHHEGMLPVESVDVSQRDDVHMLHGGAVGLAGVLFLCVTGAAPISAMLFNTPLAVGYEKKPVTVSDSFCRVIAKAQPVAGSEIGFELWLPP